MASASPTIVDAALALVMLKKYLLDTSCQLVEWRRESNVRTYDHFCVLARALEQVGDRWTLLVVRDLLGTPRRFTDLMALLGGITPKTLSQRLRELQEAGIVEVDRQPGRREVWYRLSPAGEDLAPVVEGLFLWGLRHAGRPPVPGETVHAEHLLKALQIVLDQTPPPGDRSYGSSTSSTATPTPSATGRTAGRWPATSTMCRPTSRSRPAPLPGHGSS